MTDPEQPEYLQQGSGAPLDARRASQGNRRAMWIAGGAVAGLLLLGGGAWAALSFFSQGPQPAEALPSSTVGYVAIDLDPSGGQKLEAVEMLREFPAFREEVGLDTDDDIREEIFDGLGLEEECDGLDYADDVEPWLGDRYAVAAVDLGEDRPSPVGVVQVRDAGQAEDAFSEILECSGDEAGGWAIEGEWAVLAETDEIAGEVVEETARASLSDDGTYQEWTQEVGDAGVLNMYAAPAAGAHLADSFDIFGAGAMMELSGEVPAAELPEPELPDELRQTLEDFAGMAMTVRFDDGALEVEASGDAALTQQGFPATEGGDDVVATLPEDTAFAMGLGFAEGWFADVLDRMSGMSGGMSVDELLAEVEVETGLELPEDAETLAGESAALAVSADLDAEALVNSDSPEGLPVGVKVQGDPDAIEDVLDTLRARFGPEGDVLVSESDGDLIAIGADEDYVAELAGDGDLGGTDAFENVVREVEKASAVLFLNFDAGDGWLVELAGDDEEVAENLEPLQGLGVSTWVADEAGHFLLRLTTG